MELNLPVRATSRMTFRCLLEVILRPLHSQNLGKLEDGTSPSKSPSPPSELGLMQGYLFVREVLPLTKVQRKEIY